MGKLENGEQPEEKRPTEEFLDNIAKISEYELEQALRKEWELHSEAVILLDRCLDAVKKLMLLDDMPTLDQRLEEIRGLPPEDYEGRAAALASFVAATRSLAAAELAPALNAHIHAMSHDTYEEKKDLARWVNDQLDPLGLAVREPKTGLPAKLRAQTGNWPGVGTFAIEIYVGGKQKTPTVSDALPELTLTDATPLQEPEKAWQEYVTSRDGQTKRRR